MNKEGLYLDILYFKDKITLKDIINIQQYRFKTDECISLDHNLIISKTSYLNNYKSNKAIFNLTSIYKNNNDIHKISNSNNLILDNNEIVLVIVNKSTNFFNLSYEPKDKVELDINPILNIKLLFIDNLYISNIVNLPDSLEVLSCSNNKLRHINLNNCTELMYLNCKNNELININFNNNYNLEYIDCSNNNFYIIPKIYNLKKLLYFNCSYNSINKLPKLNKCLIYLDISYTNINNLLFLPKNINVFINNISSYDYKIDRIYNLSNDYIDNNYYLEYDNENNIIKKLNIKYKDIDYKHTDYQILNLKAMNKIYKFNIFYVLSNTEFQTITPILNKFKINYNIINQVEKNWNTEEKVYLYIKK